MFEVLLAGLLLRPAEHEHATETHSVPPPAQVIRLDRSHPAPTTASEGHRAVVVVPAYSQRLVQTCQPIQGEVTVVGW